MIYLCRNVSIAFADRCSHAIIQLRTASLLRVRRCSIAYEASLSESDTNVPAQMADEPARAVLASYVSHN